MEQPQRTQAQDQQEDPYKTPPRQTQHRQGWSVRYPHTRDPLYNRHTNLKPTNIDTDAILSITIWNQPIVQYRMPNRPAASTRNRSQEHPSTAIRYALIGVYDKLNPSKLPCLLSFFPSIICVVLSCFILLADSFTMVKIDDRYPDEWNE